ncbi:MAG: hypothetical protein AAF195_04495, partial [Pseudomonadota bacterium]
ELSKKLFNGALYSSSKQKQNIPQEVNIIVATGEHGIDIVDEIQEKWLDYLQQAFEQTERKGKESIDFLKDKNYKPNSLYLWAAHQPGKKLTEEYKNHNIDLIAIPEHSINLQTLKKLHTEKKYNNGLLLTEGVAHNMTIDKILDAYDERRDEIADADKYDFVMLGGDAPDKDGKIQYYTKEEAFKLGIAIGKKSQQNNSFILACNGPRTGGFNIETGKRNNCHRITDPNTNQKIDNYQLDKVSQSFIDGLKSVGITEKNYKFYDFKYGEKSIYPALLGACFTKAKTNPYSVSAIFPGDTISMLCELNDTIGKTANVAVYYNKAMNENHKEFAKKFNLFDIEKGSIEYNFNSMSTKDDDLGHSSTAIEIAENFCKNKLFPKINFLLNSNKDKKVTNNIDGTNPNITDITKPVDDLSKLNELSKQINNSSLPTSTTKLFLQSLLGAIIFLQKEFSKISAKIDSNRPKSSDKSQKTKPTKTQSTQTNSTQEESSQDKDKEDLEPESEVEIILPDDGESNITKQQQHGASLIVVGEGHTINFNGPIKINTRNSNISVNPILKTRNNWNQVFHRQETI